MADLDNAGLEAAYTAFWEADGGNIVGIGDAIQAYLAATGIPAPAQGAVNRQTRCGGCNLLASCDDPQCPNSVAHCSPDHIEIKRLSGLLANAQRIIAEYKAGTIAGAKADVAAHGLPGAGVHGSPDQQRYRAGEPFKQNVDGPNVVLHTVFPVIEYGIGTLRVRALAVSEDAQHEIVDALSSVTSTKSGGAA